MKFYTNVAKVGNHILYRGVHKGKRVNKRIRYSPSLFLPSQKPTEYKTLDGKFVSRMPFDDIREANDFLKKYESIENFEIYGNTNFQYTCLCDLYKDKVDYDASQIIVANIDIEVSPENGMPNVDNATEEITAITFKANDKYYVYGQGDFVTDDPNVIYKRCEENLFSAEGEMIQAFLSDWEEVSPDVVTGWNIQFFDIPYLINRITRLFDEKESTRLSPWRKFQHRRAAFMGKEHSVWTIVGVSILDYIELYRKFAANADSYELNNIAHIELGEKKIDYSEYDNLHDLYKNDFQKFIEYNIKDVELVDKLEEKLQFINMVMSIAYMNKVNYSDVFAQVRMWDTIIFDYFKKKKWVFPMKKDKEKSAAYAGAYVKDPMVGMHDWVVSFDLNSLYPMLMAQYNISPETIIEDKHTIITVDDLLSEHPDFSDLKECNMTMAANGHHFSTEKQGFLPEILMQMYNDRRAAKKKMLTAKQAIETAKTKEEERKYKYEAEKYHNLQLALKVTLNSAYGALGNEYFRFFDIRQAEAVTLSGQLSIRWIEKYLNLYLNRFLRTENIDYVIAIDTDSVYLNFGPVIKSIPALEDKTTEQIAIFLDRLCSKKIEPYIDQSYQKLGDYMNVFEQKMVMARECIADKGLWTAKKRYILNVHNNEGVQYTEPKLKVMGLECVRSSTPWVCRGKIEDALKIIMRGTQSELQKFIADFEKEFYQLDPADVAFPRGVNNIDKYVDSMKLFKKGTPIHVRGSIMYNQLLRDKGLLRRYNPIQEGDKIKFAYLKEPNYTGGNVISFLDHLPGQLKLHDCIDYGMQFQKTFLDPIQVILDTIGWTTDQASSLEDLLGG